MHVMMFHSIGNENANWYRNWLSCSVRHFENLCRYLVTEGFRTIFLDEWYDLSDNAGLKDRYVVLTFDDGYADNWVYLYPLLVKFNLKATIFLNPDFIEPSEDKRRNFSDVLKGICREDELEPLGFLRWPEIIDMQNSGLVDFQSHSMTHNFNYKSEKLIDLYTGQPQYDWLAWNLFPEQKPFYMTGFKTVPVGYPVFEFDRALRIRRYIPDEQFINYCIGLKIYHNHDSADIKNASSMLEKFPGRYETDQEMEERYRYEINMSKEILEHRLGKPVNFLCWPGGGYNDVSVAFSVKAGYKASTASTMDKNIYNTPGYKRIRRFGMSSVMMANKQKFFIRHPDHMIHIFKSRTGSKLYRNLLRVKKLYFMVRASMTRKAVI